MRALRKNVQFLFGKHEKYLHLLHDYVMTKLCGEHKIVRMQAGGPNAEIPCRILVEIFSRIFPSAWLYIFFALFVLYQIAQKCKSYLWKFSDPFCDSRVCGKCKTYIVRREVKRNRSPRISDIVCGITDADLSRCWLLDVKRSNDFRVNYLFACELDSCAN